MSGKQLCGGVVRCVGCQGFAAVNFPGTFLTRAAVAESPSTLLPPLCCFLCLYLSCSDLALGWAVFRRGSPEQRDSAPARSFLSTLVA